jgi:SsrA-binding protein
VLDTWECGIMLAGAEVKSVREGRANLQDSYARIDDGEVFLFGMHVSPYSYARNDLDPVRPRKLLLHRKEIVELERGLETQGHTLVPLRVYFKDMAAPRSRSRSLGGKRLRQASIDGRRERRWRRARSADLNGQPPCAARRVPDARPLYGRRPYGRR